MTAPSQAEGREPLSVALVGYGLSGRLFHAPFIAAVPGLDLRSVVTADPARSSRARHDHPGVRVLRDVGQLWAESEAHDVVVVAAPTGNHGALARSALERDLAVVVDKPLARTAAEGRSIVELAAARGLALTVFHNRRWDSDHLTVRALVAAGTLGTIVRYESRMERWQPVLDRARWRERLSPEEGGGVLLDLGSHLVDQALTLFGPVAGVYGEIASRRGGSDDECFLALAHRSGVRSHLSLGLVFARPGPRLRVIGDQGSFELEGVDGQEAALRGGALPDTVAFGLEPPERWGTVWTGGPSAPVTSERGRWIEFYTGLERSLRDGAPLPVDPRDAIAGLAVLDAARRSSSTGEVTVPSDG